MRQTRSSPRSFLSSAIRRPTGDLHASHIANIKISGVHQGINLECEQTETALERAYDNVTILEILGLAWIAAYSQRLMIDTIVSLCSASSQYSFGGSHSHPRVLMHDRRTSTATATINQPFRITRVLLCSYSTNLQLCQFYEHDTMTS